MPSKSPLERVFLFVSRKGKFKKKRTQLFFFENFQKKILCSSSNFTHFQKNSFSVTLKKTESYRFVRNLKKKFSAVRQISCTFKNKYFSFSMTLKNGVVSFLRNLKKNVFLGARRIPRTFIFSRRP